MLVDAARGEKVIDLAHLFGDDKYRQLLYAKLVLLLETLQPIHGIQKQLESGEPLLHRMFHMVSVNLQTEISRYSTPFTLGNETTTVLNMLTSREAPAIPRLIFMPLASAFPKSGRIATGQRNLLSEVSGPIVDCGSKLWY